MPRVPFVIDPELRECTEQGSGYGFFNSATATSGEDEITDDDCGPIPSLPVPTVDKVVNGGVPVQQPDGSWTITYTVTATNDDPDYGTFYELTDTLQFGGGIEIISAEVEGQNGLTTNPDWDGQTDVDVFVGARIIAADTDHSLHGDRQRFRHGGRDVGGPRL